MILNLTINKSYDKHKTDTVLGDGYKVAENGGAITTRASSAMVATSTALNY